MFALQFSLDLHYFTTGIILKYKYILGPTCAKKYKTFFVLHITIFRVFSLSSTNFLLWHFHLNLY